MTNRFDLEQQILACWNIIDELDYLLELSESKDSVDEMQNLILGLKQLYQMKFEKCFDTFEKCLNDGSFRKTEEFTKNWPDWGTE